MRKLLAVSVALNAALGLSLLWLGSSHELAGVHAEGGSGGGTPVGNGDVNGDGMVDLSDAVSILNWLFLGGSAPLPIECPLPAGGPLPATGQTECYGLIDGQGWVAVPCEEAEIPGQDAAYMAGCPVEGRYVDSGDGTVTDTCTGLMWQQDTADVDGDGTIDWTQGGTDTLTWREALEYCEDLEFAGHVDWRLPNLRELHSMVDYGPLGPSVDPVFTALSRPYWSSTTCHGYLGYAWLVHFWYGSVDASAFDKSGRTHLRAVRSVR